MKIIVSLTHAWTVTIIRDIHNYFMFWDSFKIKFSFVFLKPILPHWYVES